MDQNNSSPWWQEILNQKNLSATSNNSSSNTSGGNSNPLSGFGGSINSEQSNNSTPTGNFSPQSSVPNAAQQATPLSSNTGQANSSVGNTASQTNTANSINQSTNQTLLNPQQNQQQSGQGSTGLSGFDSIASKLGSGAAKAIGFSSQGIVDSVNGFGEGLGFGTGVPAEAFGPSAAGAAEAYGPAYQGAAGSGSLTGASLSNVLGGAGFGVGIGSLLSGFTGGNQTNSSIGGGIGGALGAATGISSGIAMGATLGSIVPGLGTVIGAVGGALIGGMFGPGAPTNADDYVGTLGNPQGTETSKNAGPTKGFGQTVVTGYDTLAQSAAKTLGINFNPQGTVQGAISTLHPGPGGPAEIGVNNNATNDATTAGGGTGKIFFNPQDNKSVADAYYKALSFQANQAGYTDNQALYNWFYGQGPLSNNNNTNATNNNVNIAPVGNYGNSGPIIA